jgi:hypothetical protein
MPDETEVMKAAAEGSARGVTDSLLEPLKAALMPFCKEVGVGFGHIGHAIQIKLLQRAKRMLADAGKEPQQVPIKLLAPVLSQGGLEEDPSLQERWSALLANAADPRRTTAVPVSFTTILKDLEPSEASYLDSLFDSLSGIEVKPNGATLGTERRLLDNYAGLETNPAQRDAHFWRTINNLTRLGLVERHPPKVTDQDSDVPFGMSGADRVKEMISKRFPFYSDDNQPTLSLSRLGLDFVRACRRPPHDASP